MPRDVTSLQVPESSGSSPGHQGSGTVGSTSSEPPPSQMFAHASHFNIVESVFATGPVNVTYAAERNTEEILKVSFLSDLRLTDLIKHQDHVLRTMARSPQAYYDADIGVKFSHRFCTPGTRQNILAEIDEWASSPDSMLGYWMCGMAGTGKSTIAMSISKMLKEKDILAGTFFCSRQIPECRDYRLLVPTLAYQLARFSKTFAASLMSTLSADPDITVKKRGNTSEYEGKGEGEELKCV